jgi:peptide/nickel transport system permease protein
MIYLAKRLLYGVFVLLGLSLLMFLMVRVMPGDPVRLVLGPMATEEDAAKLRHQMGLDRPIYIQYIKYIQNICLNGELGISLSERRDVSEIISEKLPATIELVLLAIVIAVVIAIPLGVIAATHRNGVIDYIGRFLALSGVSLPQFWVCLLVQLAFGYFLGLLPLTGRLTGTPPSHITGLYLIDSLITLNFGAFADSFLHVISPAFVLSLSPLANVTRLVRASMIDELSKDYAQISQARGMSEIIVHYKYVLRNAFSSALTMIGFLIPLMIGSAFVVETVFAWPGIARFGADSIINNDFNGVVGVALIIGAAFVLINIIIDALYAVLDPRIRLAR